MRPNNNNDNPPSARPRRRAFSSIYVALLLVPLAGFASLSIDIGRVRLARADLQAAADAAARAGASGLPVGTDAAQSRALTYAAANTCLGTPVALRAASDIELGRWNAVARKFTPIASTGKANDPARTANAAHVIARRAAARNNPVPLTIAVVVTGTTAADVATDAIALITGGPTRFGIVALNKYDANGNNATIDSYDASTENYPGAGGPNSNASLASNGHIDLGNGDVYGDVRAGIGQTIDMGPNATVTGWRNNLDQTLSYPPATVPPGALPLPTSSPIPGGSPDNPTLYQVKDLSGDLTFTGSVKIYVTGNLDLNGNRVITADDLPANLEIDVVGSGKVDLGGNSEMYAHVYAPQSDVTIHGTPGFYGWLVGKSVTLKGTAKIHYDESIQDMTPYQISLVK